MSWTRQAGGLTVHVLSAADPEANYKKHREAIEERIRADGYEPEHGMDNLVAMAVLSFDSDDSYGEYDPETGCGGYGGSFTLEGLFRYVEDSGGWKELDYIA